jgi:lipopolysaccharide export LptBFGC system permease protein LptF
MFKNKLLIPLYLLKESALPILITFTILSILVFCQQISRNSELIFSPIITWKISAQILLNLLPPICTFTLPVALVLGEILAISRFAADAEWFILETSTLAHLPRLAPFFFYGMAGFVLLLFLNWSIGPQSIAQIKEIRNSLSLDKAASQIQPQIFISQFPNHLLRISSLDRDTGKWNGVFLLKKDEANNKIQLLAAKSGSLTPLNQSATVFEIKLSDGIYIDNLISVTDHVTSAFRENAIRVSTTLQGPNADITTTSSFIPNSATQAAFTNMDVLLRGLTIAQDKATKNELELEIFKRLANALACIYAVCVTLFLATFLRPRSSKRALYTLVGFLFLVIYYTCITFGQNLAIKGKVSGRHGILLGCSIPFLALLASFFALQHRRLRGRGVSSLYSANSTRGKADSGSNIATYNQPNYSASALRALPRFQIDWGHYLILSEFAKYFTLTIFILTAAILLFTLLDIAPSLAKNSIPISYTVGYLINLAPQIIYYINPFAILIAVTTTATILARTGQLTILLYNSDHPFKLVLPVLTAVIGVFLSALYVSDSILPLTNREQDYRYNKIKGRALEEGNIAFDRRWLSKAEHSIYGYRLFQDKGQTQLSALVFHLDNPNYYISEATYIERIPLDYNATLIAANNSRNFRYLIGSDGLAKIAPLDVSDTPYELKNRVAAYERNYREANKLTFHQLQNYIKQVERAGAINHRAKA